MTVTLAILDEICGLLGLELPAEVRDSLGRIELAERHAGVTTVTVTSPGASTGPSPAALRTRRWRERKRLAAAPTVTGDPVTASPNVTPSVTPVTGRDAVRQKEVPPTPPLRKTTHPQKGASRRHRRDAVMEAEMPREQRTFVEDHTALFRELVALRGRGASVPTAGTGGWWFTPAEIARARHSLERRVAVFPSRLAMTVATGPPKTAGGSG